MAVTLSHRHLAQALALFALTTPSSLFAESKRAIEQQWDWHRLGKQQATNAAQQHCRGYYQAPEADWPDADSNAEDLPLRAGADNSSLNEQRILLEGDVVITKGSRLIKADRAELDRSSNQLDISGNIVIREPGFLLRGDSGVIHTETGLGQLNNARILQHESGVRITSVQSSRPELGLLTLNDTQYTLCPPNDESWQLTADYLSLDQNTGWGKAKHTTIRIRNVPVFYAPYFTFPIDDRRHSGFLWPSLANDDENGLSISTPYYLNIAPNLDATVTPRYIEHRGNLAELEGRYLNTMSYWVLSGANLDEDRLTGDRRWLASLSEKGSFNAHWHHEINYSKVSDEDYFDDLSVDSLEVKRQNSLQQQAQLNFASDQWRSSLLVEQHQNLNGRFQSPYQRLPQFQLEKLNNRQSFKANLSWLAEFTDFDHEDAKEDGGNKDTGQRSYSEIGLSYPMDWAPGFITPSIKLKHVGYQLDGLSSGNDTPEATVASGSVDMGLFFERGISLFDRNFTQTLEPRVYHLYSDYEDQSAHPSFDSRVVNFRYEQLFQDSRFSGHDFLDDANQTSVGLSSRFIDKDSYREWLSLSVGQIFYWQDRRVGPTGTQSRYEERSEIAGEAALQPADDIWLNVSTLWNPDRDQINQANLNGHYQQEGEYGQHMFNLGYSYHRKPISNDVDGSLKQADLSAVLAIAPRWSVMAKYQYDLQNHRGLEDLVGIEYQDCCWMTRLVYQRTVKEVSQSSAVFSGTERDHQIVLQFQLKGLGGIGNKAANLLKESILGYQP